MQQFHFAFIECRDVAMFYEDEEIDERFRSRLTDFRGSGYDRGHMVSLTLCSFEADPGKLPPRNRVLAPIRYFRFLCLCRKIALAWGISAARIW